MENSRKNCIDFIYKIFANDCKNDKNLEKKYNHPIGGKDFTSLPLCRINNTHF